MATLNLLEHQKCVIENTKDKNNVAYYLDMGLGKTFVGAEKMMSLATPINLVICQKSKIKDWVEHFNKYYFVHTFDLSMSKDFNSFFGQIAGERFTVVGIINYELAFRRSELSELNNFTLMLDESSMIQNECAKRSKFILNNLNPKNVILLSGTPTSGKYERLWSQMNLLGWEISKDMYYRHYVDVKMSDDGYPVIVGYKNVERLKKKMRDYGCVFMKTEEVIDLPEQTFIDIRVGESKEYKKFRKSGIVIVGDEEIVGDTVLTKLLYSRMLCGHHNKEKLEAFKDIIESTEDRFVVFYNFNDELNALVNVANECNRPWCVVNGKEKNLEVYENHDDSIVFVQYQAGAMGLNLQMANKVVYFTPTLSSELFEQSKKRIHRIGQNKPCFYYQLKCGVEHNIYNTLAMRKDYTDALFEEDENNGNL